MSHKLYGLKGCAFLPRFIKTRPSRGTSLRGSANSWKAAGSGVGPTRGPFPCPSHTWSHGEFQDPSPRPSALPVCGATRGALEVTRSPGCCSRSEIRALKTGQEHRHHMRMRRQHWEGAPAGPAAPRRRLHLQNRENSVRAPSPGPTRPDALTRAFRQLCLFCRRGCSCRCPPQRRVNTAP